MKLLSTILSLSLLTASCGSFKAKRVDANESDEKGLAITDNWMSADTTQAIADVVKQMRAHPGFGKMKARHGVGSPGTELEFAL